MAITLTDDQLPQLLHSLQDNPQAFNIRGEITCKLNSVITDFDFIVDSWPDYKALVVRVNPATAKSAHLRRPVSVYARDTATLETLLQKPGILDWSKPIVFLFVGRQTRPAVENAIRQQNRPYQPHEFFFLTVTKDSVRVIPVPEGFKLENIRPDQATLLSSVWELSTGEDTVTYIKDTVAKLPSICLYNGEGDVVGFALRYHYGTVGMLHVFEEYRGKGYGKVIMSHLADSCLKMDKEVFMIAEKENIPSVKLHESIGFKKIPDAECAELWVNI